ncbi:cadherin-like domain-containing protein [Terasakiella sp.]|uniref:cadherin-like domain-containing protein n=1 Tax=Terasakiella sp. TaxID=2034861 RepID=UPI003AA8C313
MKTVFDVGDSHPFHVLEPQGSTPVIQLPEGLSMSDATVIRDGTDMIIESAQGDHFLIQGYYQQEHSPNLQQANGEWLNTQAYDNLPDIDSINQYTQAAPVLDIPGLQTAQATPQGDVALGEPIGLVEEISGSVSVVRADGSSAILNTGDPVFQGDRLETSTDGGVGITLADTSTFSLGENSEMVLDELVYDPGNQEGSSVLSLIEGTASYVSGQIAKINPDAVAINTPVATIGIRGTKVFLEYAEGKFRAINLIETTLEGDTPGEIVIFALNGSPLGSTNQANVGWSWDGGSANDFRSSQFSTDEINRFTRDTLNHLPPSLAEKALEAKELEAALKEAAEIAAREAQDAEAQAQQAEADAQALKQAADDAKLEADALAQQALTEEEKLQLLQEQLQELIASGATDQEILQLQQALSKLEFNLQQIWQNAESARQSALQAEDKATQAYQFMLEAREEAQQANAAAEVAQNAAHGAYEITQNAFQRAREYVGYEANTNANPGESNNQFADKTTDGPQNGEQQEEGNEDGNHVFVPHENDDDNGSSGPIVVAQLDNGESGNYTGETGQNDEDENAGKQEEENTTPVNNDPEPVSLSGKGVDGYLSGADVWIDLDKDGVMDANETDRTITDSSGNYTLSTSANDYIISMSGGTDIATGKAFYGVLQAPEGSTVVTPLTTLLANGVSESDLKATFGLRADLDLTTTDPVAGASNSDIAKLAAVGVQIQNTIVQAASVLEGSSSTTLDAGATGNTLFGAIADAIKTQGSSFNISDASKIQSVISQAAGDLLSGDDLTKANAAAANSAQIISASNSVVDDYIALGGTGNDFLSSLAQVAVVASNAASDLQTAVRDNSDLSNLQNQYSATNLTSKIEGAAIGDVNGDGSTNTSNAAPTISEPTSFTTLEDQAITLSEAQLLANASDTETMHVRKVTVSGATVQDNGNQTWTITPNADSTETLTLSYEVSDGFKSTPTTAQISITPVNDAPVLSGPVTLSSDSEGNYQEDSTINLTKSQLLAHASDIDGDSLDILNVVATSGGAVVDNGNGTWTVTPTLNSTDDVILSYTVSDGKGASVQQTATLEIQNVNDAPTLSNTVILNGTEDTVLSISKAQLLAYANDVDGDTLSIENFAIDGRDQQGSLEETADGWLYTPGENSTSDITFTYTISDGNGGTIDTTATAKFGAVNDAPTVSSTPVSLSGTEDTVLTITQDQLLNEYASDVDGDTLNIENLATNDGGSVQKMNATTWTYTPAANANGDVSFTFKVSDGTTTTDGHAVVSIASVDDAPIITGTATFSVYIEDTVFLSQSQLLAYAIDIDTDSANLSITDISFSSGYTSETDGGWSFTPQCFDNVTVTYNVYDGTSKTATTATINVHNNYQGQEGENPNIAPTLGDAVSLSGLEDGGEAGYITITPAQLLNGSYDQNEDSISVANLSISSGTGSLAFNSQSGNWHFTPTANSTAPVTFTYNISDGQALSAQQTATLTLSPVNDAPTISNLVSFNATEDTAFDLTAAQLLANATDVDGDDMVIQNLTASSGSLVATENGWTFTPAENATDDVTFSYTISDNNGGTLATTATVHFTDVNDAPIVSAPISLNGQEDTSLTFTKAQLLANTTDVDNDSLQIQNLQTNAGGTLTYNANDSWTYTPVANSTDDVTFTYTVSDGLESVSTQAVASFAEDGITEGTSTANTLSGTEGSDTITALAGNDQLTGGSGNDYLDGGDGDDTAVFNGNRDDYTFATNENGELTITDNNTADGDDGQDTLIDIENYQFADQVITGTPGEIVGSSGSDQLSGGNGADVIRGGDGADFIWSHNGNDVIYGGSGNDFIWTDNGDDTVYGEGDNDNIWTGKGADTVYGGSGDDFIWTGRDGDTASGGEGADIIYTSYGDDTIIYSDGDVTLNGGSGTDTLRLDNGDNLDLTTNSVQIYSIEQIDLQTDGNANSLIFEASDITSMSSNDSVIINGTSSDSVTFADSGWSQGTTSNGYTTYDHSSSGAQASVAENINVTLNNGLA